MAERKWSQKTKVTETNDTTLFCILQNGDNHLLSIDDLIYSGSPTTIVSATPPLTLPENGEWFSLSSGVRYKKINGQFIEI